MSIQILAVNKSIRDLKRVNISGWRVLVAVQRSFVQIMGKQIDWALPSSSFSVWIIA